MDFRIAPPTIPSYIRMPKIQSQKWQPPEKGRSPSFPKFILPSLLSTSLPTSERRELITRNVLDSQLCLLSLTLPPSNTPGSNRRSALSWATKPPGNTFSPSQPQQGKGSVPLFVFKNRISGPLNVQKAIIKSIYESNNPQVCSGLYYTY